MNDFQVDFKKKIPAYIALASVVMFALMAVPFSHYTFFSQYHEVVQDGILSGDNIYYTLGSMSAIFSILLLCIIVLLALLSVFMTSFYNYHLVTVIILVLFSMQTTFEVLFFASAFQTRSNESFSSYSICNIIPLIANLLLLIAYVATFILFDHIPFCKIKASLSRVSSVEEKEISVSENISKEEIKQNEKAEIEKNNKQEMIKMVTKLLDEKKITKEEADKMIDRIIND